MLSVVWSVLYFVFSPKEVTFDERIALELDALDQLGTVESPVAERQMIAFHKPQPENSPGNIENNDQLKASNKSDESQRVEKMSDRPENCQVVDCDEVRIMIKVLGNKVCYSYFDFCIQYFS